MSSRRSRLLTWGALSVGAVILLSSCSSGAVDSSTSTTASTASAQPTTTGVDEEAARLAAQQSAAESARLAQEDAARVAAEQENARLAAEEAARVEAERVAAEQAAAEQAAAEQAAAEQAAAEQAERQAVEEQTQFDAAVEAGSCTEAPEDRVGECVVLVEERGAEAAAESGWYDPSGQWISPETAKRALAAGIPPGGSVPGYLRCGTICGEGPTSGELQYEYWLEQHPDEVPSAPDPERALAADRAANPEYWAERDAG